MTQYFLTPTDSASVAYNKANQNFTSLFGAKVKLDSWTVATAPDPSEHEGELIYVSDGDAGNPCLAYSDGSHWLRISLGAAISARAFSSAFSSAFN